MQVRTVEAAIESGRIREKNDGKEGKTLSGLQDLLRDHLDGSRLNMYRTKSALMQEVYETASQGTSKCIEAPVTATSTIGMMSDPSI